MPLLPIGSDAGQPASLGGLIKYGSKIVEQVRPYSRQIGNTISVGVAIEKVERVLSDAQADANQKATTLFNALIGRLKASPVGRFYTFDELVSEASAAGIEDPAQFARFLIPQFLDP